MIEVPTFTVDPIAVKDLAIGFFVGLALKRGRIKAILDQFLTVDEK